MGASQSRSLSIGRVKEVPIDSAQDIVTSDIYKLGDSGAKDELSTNTTNSRIIVVNSSTQTKHTNARHKRSHIILPPRVLPILSIEGHQIDPRRHPFEHQLSPAPWIECITTLEQHFRNRADLVTARQSQLQDKIIQTEDFVARFTEAYVNDKHKAIAKINDDSRKVDELYNIMNKCERLTDSCLDSMKRLNSLLPASLALEEFS